VHADPEASTGLVPAERKEPMREPEPLVEFFLLYPDAPLPEPASNSVRGSLPSRAVRLCQPILAASAFGWYVFPPVDFALRWDGHATEWSLLEPDNTAVIVTRNAWNRGHPPTAPAQGTTRPRRLTTCRGGQADGREQPHAALRHPLISTLIMGSLARCHTNPITRCRDQPTPVQRRRRDRRTTVVAERSLRTGYRPKT
jgi:hypothetical protein